MPGRTDALAHAARFVHRHFLLFLLGAYVIAAVAPAGGLAIRNVRLGEFKILGRQIQVSLPALMLGLLLFNAGLGAQSERLLGLIRKPLLLVAGLAANLGFHAAQGEIVGATARGEQAGGEEAGESDSRDRPLHAS